MKLIVNDQLVTYSDEGKGRVILLLHGWGATLHTFDAMAAQLATSFRVIRLDLPGFGQSPKPQEDWHVDDYAQFITNFLQKLDIDDVYCLAGHSFGGRVSIKAVGNGYVTPEKVILIDSAGVKPVASAQKLLYKSVAKVGKQVTKLPLLGTFQTKLRRRLYESVGSTDYLDAEGMRPIFLNTINEDLQADAAKIAQPSLLIWGEHDDSTPVADAQKLQSAIKNSSLTVIPGAGHFVYLDKPAEATKAIQDFLQ